MPLESQKPAVAPPRIVTPNGKTIAWDDDDRLWLLRAVEAEGAPQDLVAQTLVNRWAWLWDTTPARYVKLRELVRAYAQPVNPAWFPDGGLHVKAYDNAATQQIQNRMLAAAIRRRDVHATRTKFSPSTEAAVHRALYGPLTLPPGALHFAAPTLVRTDLPVLVPSENGSNVIYGESQGRGSRARYALTSGTTTSGRKVLGIVALISIGLGAALFGGRK